jgi:hypothetical protein
MAASLFYLPRSLYIEEATLRRQGRRPSQPNDDMSDNEINAPRIDNQRGPGFWLRLAVLLILLTAVAFLATAGRASLERFFLFFPTRRPHDNDLTPWRKGEEIIGYARLVESPQNVWLMLHGNAGQASDRVYAIPCFSDEDAVFVMEYPGYGRRPGVPSKGALIRRPQKPISICARPTHRRRSAWQLNRLAQGRPLRWRPCPRRRISWSLSCPSPVWRMWLRIIFQRFWFVGFYKAIGTMQRRCPITRGRLTYLGRRTTGLFLSDTHGRWLQPFRGRIWLSLRAGIMIGRRAAGWRYGIPDFHPLLSPLASIRLRVSGGMTILRRSNSCERTGRSEE